MTTYTLGMLLFIVLTLAISSSNPNIFLAKFSWLTMSIFTLFYPLTLVAVFVIIVSGDFGDPTRPA